MTTADAESDSSGGGGSGLQRGGVEFGRDEVTMGMGMGMDDVMGVSMGVSMGVGVGVGLGGRPISPPLSSTMSVARSIGSGGGSGAGKVKQVKSKSSKIKEKEGDKRKQRKKVKVSTTAVEVVDDEFATDSKNATTTTTTAPATATATATATVKRSKRREPDPTVRQRQHRDRPSIKVKTSLDLPPVRERPLATEDANRSASRTVRPRNLRPAPTTTTTTVGGVTAFKTGRMGYDLPTQPHRRLPASLCSPAMIRADFSMGDLEAALTLRYVARDAELIAASANEEGNGGIVDPVEELANAQAKKEEARRKNGVVRTLQKGRCENCGMDEVRLRVGPLSRGVSTEPPWWAP
jgi:hypothetical protein